MERERKREINHPPRIFEPILPSCFFLFFSPSFDLSSHSLTCSFSSLFPSPPKHPHQFPADSASLGASLDPGSMPDGEGGNAGGNTNTNNINTSGGGGGGNTATRGAATAGAGATTDNGALPGGGAGGAAAAAAGAHTYVWGTNIDIASISRRLRRFLTGEFFF